MEPIIVIDRETGKKIEEKVFGGGLLKAFYGNPFGRPFAHLISRIPLISSLYGAWQKTSLTRKNIAPFIKTYQIDKSEFRQPIEEFRSFNDFFIRKLKHECRPIAQGQNIAVMPADGRYRFFQNIQETDGFIVKGEKFDLSKLIGDPILSEKYASGTMVMARLCPTDYHRFHFPVDCTPSSSHLINGYLYSVNPIALKQNIHIFTKNKRKITHLESEEFGKVIFIEVGATNVGSIHENFEPNFPYKKGEEKGYFSFGASSLVILFEPGKIVLDPDLTQQNEFELLCKMGTRLGKAK